MDERALLEAIGKMMDVRDKKLEAMIDAKLEPVKAEQAATNKRLGKMQTDLDILKEDVGILKEDVGILKEDVGILKEDVGILKEDVGILKEDVGILKEDVGILKEDVGILKEDSTITRSAVNTLLEWAEEAQIEVKIPLYKKAQ